MSTCGRFPSSSQITLGLVLTVLVGTGSTPSGAQRLGDEVQINTWTTGGQEDPSVGGAPNGEFVVAWSSYGQDPGCFVYAGTPCDVLIARRVSAAGDPVGDEIRVSAALETQNNAAVARSADGFVVAWDTDVFLFQAGKVQVRVFDAEGNAAAPAFMPDPKSPGAQVWPAVDLSPDGELVVVWRHRGPFPSTERGVYGRRYDATGAPLGEPFAIRPTSTLLQGLPAVATGESGSFVVTWIEQPPEDGLRVSARRYDEAGLPLDDGFKVNEGGGMFADPRIGMDDAGGFVVAWDRRNAGNEWEISARRFGEDGLPLGPEFQVNTYSTALQRNAQVGVDGAGRFLVVWESESQDGSDFGIFAQAFDGDGGRIGSEFRVNAWTTGAQSYPSVAAAGPDRFLVAWGSEGQDGSSSGIFARVVVLPLFADGFESGDTSGWSCTGGDDCP